MFQIFDFQYMFESFEIFWNEVKVERIKNSLENKLKFNMKFSRKNNKSNYKNDFENIFHDN
jgi:hypothetical protein